MDPDQSVRYQMALALEGLTSRSGDMAQEIRTILAGDVSVAIRGLAGLTDLSSEDVDGFDAGRGRDP
jgi:hypothetical protein